MRKVLITFSGARYHLPTKKIVENAPRFGADQVLVYDDQWLHEVKPEFIRRIWNLLTHSGMRGYGWFAWKPLVILDALTRVGPEDVIFFTDGDTWPIHDLQACWDITARDGIMLFSAVGHTQRMWMKRDASIIMGIDHQYLNDKLELRDPAEMDAYRVKYIDRQHAVGRFMGFTHRHQAFLEEWLNYMCDIRCNTFDPSQLAPENQGFHQHRCDQALLGALACKYEHRLYREACQFGNHMDTDKDLFPQLFEQDGSHSWDSPPRKGSSFRNV